jgi:hypothetical protein
VSLVDLWTTLLEDAGAAAELGPGYMSRAARMVGRDVRAQLLVDPSLLPELVPLALSDCSVGEDPAPSCRGLPTATVLEVDRAAILWDRVRIGTMRQVRGGGDFVGVTPMLPGREFRGPDERLVAAFVVEALGVAEAAGLVASQGFATHWTIRRAGLEVQLHAGAACRLERITVDHASRWRGVSCTGHATAPVMTPRRAIEALWKLATALAVLDDPSLVVSPNVARGGPP